MKQRDTAIDIAKAIGIILMIIGHCAIPASIRNLIFSFHMPLFIIFSGYFFKQQDTTNVIKKGFTHLVKPYVITAIVCIILCVIKQNYEGALSKCFAMMLGSGSGHWFGDKAPVIGPIWFLLSLFWCKVIYNIIVQKTKHVFIVSFMISTIAFVFGKYVTTLPLGILYGLCSLVFYSMGHYWRESNFKPNYIHLTVGCLVWFVCVWKGYLEMANYSCSLYPISMIGAFVGTYITYLCSKKIPIQLSSMMVWIGNNTMLILCYHTIYFYIEGVLNHYIFAPNGIKLTSLLSVVLSFTISFGFPIIHTFIVDKFIKGEA